MLGWQTCCSDSGGRSCASADPVRKMTEFSHQTKSLVSCSDRGNTQQDPMRTADLSVDGRYEVSGHFKQWLSSVNPFNLGPGMLKMTQNELLTQY